MVKLEQCVIKMLDLSTAHIPRATDRALADETGPLGEVICYSATDYGWRVHLAAYHTERLKAVAALRLLGHSELAALLRLTDELGCATLQLDADAERAAGLTTFDW